MIAGIAAAFLGIVIWVLVVIKAASMREPTDPIAYVVLFLLVGMPGIIVVIGTYLQAIRRKPWAVALVFMGGVGILFFIVLNAWLNYYFVQNAWVRRAIAADSVVLVFALATALINMLASNVFANEVK